MNSKPPFWFPAKRYGWGWGVPVRWQGWVVAVGYVVLMLATVILALSNAVAPWLAALIVTVAIFLVVGVLALLGVRRLKRGMPPTPEHAMENVQQDVAAVKGGLH